MYYVLNRDWQYFTVAFREELLKLGASEMEIASLLRDAWEYTSEVHCIAEYAEREVTMLRETKQRFATDLRDVLSLLGATSDEIDDLIAKAWEIATEHYNAERYAEFELKKLRGRA